jgi:hypothetical protein
MKIRRIVLFVMLFLCSYNLLAQTEMNIRITDATNSPLPYAQISYFSKDDSSALQYAVADSLGLIHIIVKDFPINITAEYIGYKSKKVVCDKAQTLSISLEEDVQSLKGVTITGTRPKLKLSGEGFVANIQSSALSKVGSAEDVLQHIPLIRNTHEGLVVFGKGKPTIYIDGKEMRNQDELKELKSTDINEIEVVTNPSSKYDATVKSVIKIKTKRHKDNTLSADAMIKEDLGRKNKYLTTESVSVEKRTKRLDILGSLWYSMESSTQLAKINSHKNTNGITDESSTLNDVTKSRNAHINLGLNYDLNDSNSIGIKYTLYIPTHDNSNTHLDNSLTRESVLYDHLTNNTDSKTSNRTGHTLNVYYDGKIGKVELETDFTYLNNGHSETNAIKENSTKIGERLLSTKNTVKNSLYAFKFSANIPAWKGSVDLGTEDSYTKRGDDFYSNNDYVRSSNSHFDKKYVSIFGDYSLGLPFGNLTAGVRYEHFDYKYSGDNVIKKTYNNFFPSISFSTQIGAVRLLASYSSKTERPEYKQLSNDVFYASMYSLQTGNPLLNNTTIRDANLSVSWRFLQFQLDYTNYHDAIIYFNYPYANNDMVTMTTYRNIPTIKQLTPVLVIYPSFGIYSPQLTIALQKQWVKSKELIGETNLTKPILLIGFSNTFDFGKKWLLDMNLNFQGKGDYQNAHIQKNVWGLDLGISKSWFNGKLNIKLEGQDLLNMNNDASIIYSPHIQLSQTNKYYRRMAVLTLRYHLNEKGNKRNSTRAGQEEIDKL